jgi:hypothetical protein
MKPLTCFPAVREQSGQAKANRAAPGGYPVRPLRQAGQARQHHAADDK